MNLNKSILGMVILFGMTVAPLLSHHSVASEFDAARATTLQGIITRVEWINPHVWITLDSRNANGSIVSWRVEIGSPNLLFRSGIPKELIELNKLCSMEVWPARNGSQSANGRTLSFMDGTKLDVSDKFDAVLRTAPERK